MARLAVQLLAALLALTATQQTRALPVVSRPEEALPASCAMPAGVRLLNGSLALLHPRLSQMLAASSRLPADATATAAPYVFQLDHQGAIASSHYLEADTAVSRFPIGEDTVSLLVVDANCTHTNRACMQHLCLRDTAAVFQGRPCCVPEGPASTTSARLPFSQQRARRA
jgi:hypothetical protein